MKEINDLSEQELTDALTYAGFVLVAFELIKSLIVNPIKEFYKNTTFKDGPFKSYKDDVLSRNKNEFEACLFYLSDFMKAIDSDDLIAIQFLRKHRNDLAHNLANNISHLNMKKNFSLLDKANKALFKLSNYRAYMEIGADPNLRNKGINWETLKGHEYLLFENIVNKVRLLKNRYT